MRILCCALICLIVSGCLGNDEPENLVKEDTYINLLVELHLLKTYLQQPPDSTTNIDSLQAAIYAEYGVTEKQFQESHTYYQQDIKKQSKRIKKAIEELRKDRLQPKDTAAVKDSAAAELQNAEQPGVDE